MNEKQSCTNYTAIYREIVQKRNEDTLIRVLKETGHWEKLKALDLKIIDDATLPYVLIGIDYAKDFIGYFSSAMIGINLDRDSVLELCDQYRYECFYLPVIVKPRKLPEIAKKYFSEENSIEHELMHVSDILRWISEDPPAYIEAFLNYGRESATEDTLDKSIDFEVRKIFVLEPQAIGHDFDNGEDMIIEPFLFAIVLEYRCSTKKEFIEMHLADYITELKHMYEEKFPRKKDEIERFFEESVGRYGKEEFGPDPYRSLQKTRKEKTGKLLSFGNGFDQGL